MKNWLSGLSVALVSIPLSLALAIASGATPEQGIITAVWAGLVGALFGGSQFNIIGPTGALSGILIAYTIHYGFEGLPLIALLSGLMILLGYFLRLDKYIIFIPRSVIHGFTLGIAFIIVCTQAGNMLNLSLEKSSNMLIYIRGVFQLLPNAHWDIFIVFLTGVVLIIVWNKLFSKIPAPIIISILGIIGAFTVNKLFPQHHLPVLFDAYPNLSFSLFKRPEFSWSLLTSKPIWMASFSTSIIAILETLISGQIADKMTASKFDRPKELLGLALANIVSGFMGGIPATAALARTALNIRSGATHRLSGIMSSIFIGILALLLFKFLLYLPLSIIASILVIVAIGMIEKRHFIRLIESDKVSLGLSLLVALITVIEDPILGIITGSFLALLIFVKHISQGQTEISFYHNGSLIQSLFSTELAHIQSIVADTVVYTISGTLTYINMPAHLESAAHIRTRKYVIISLQHAFYADSDGVEYLKEIIDALKAHNGTIILAGVNKLIRQQIVNEDFYKQKEIAGKIYPSTSIALGAVC